MRKSSARLVSSIIKSVPVSYGAWSYVLCEL